MKTLSDYIDFELEILSIGLNPSTISVQCGYYFANPRNRFWKALNASSMVNEQLTPSIISQQKLLHYYKIGFTDVVKRHSSMSKNLHADDYKKWSPKLLKLISDYQPKICWFHGKVAMQKFLQYSGLGKFQIQWGLQEFNIDKSIVFVTPNPSSANAAYSLQALVAWYQKLHALHCEIST